MTQKIEMTAREIFAQTIEFLKGEYPNRQIDLIRSTWGDIVQIDGELKFNTAGYNLLYNLKRLTEILEDELI